MPKSLSARALSPPPPRKTKRRAGFEELFKLKHRLFCHPELVSGSKQYWAKSSDFVSKLVRCRIKFGMTPSFLTKETKTNPLQFSNLARLGSYQIKTNPLQFSNSAKLDCYQIKGFTLAETLITLAIIGVVAALTVPNLLRKYEEYQTVQKVKVAHSILSAGWKKAVTELGRPTEWGIDLTSASWNNPQMSQIFFEKIEPYFKFQKVCGVSSNCWASNKKTKYLNGSECWMIEQSRMATAILENGMRIAIFRIGNTTPLTTFGSSEMWQYGVARVFVWVNPKGPKIIGKDIFVFAATPHGIYPQGAPGDEQYPFASNCRNASGESCAAWVIYKGNMDYLRKNVSWND